MHDLLISNAVIHDGLGNAPFTGQLAVTGGRISAVRRADNPIPASEAREQLDAQGLSLMPGIIDNHTHYDAQITWDPYLDQSIGMGVTTAIIGNCGFTIAPCRPDAASRDLVTKNLTQVEGMSLASLQAGIRWQFESFAQYLDQIEAGGCAMNLAAFVGHSTVRTYVMGSAASDRAATPEEVARMKALIDEALAAGAIGLASTTTTSHSAYDGRPMPSRLADWSEFIELAEPLRRRNQGVFMITKGPPTPVSKLEEFAAASGRPVLVAALLHSSLTPDSVFQDLEGIHAANARGNRMRGAVAATPLVFDFSFESPYPLEPLLAWKPIFGLKGDALIARMRDPALRAALREELSVPARRIFSGNWRLIQVLETVLPENRHLVDRSIADIAAERGVDPLDCLFDLAIAENLGTLFSLTALNHDEQAVAKLLTHEDSLLSLSDAGAHLSFLDDSGFGLHLMGHWVRDKGVMPLPEAVRRLTSAQAEFFGIRERGTLREGWAADLLLFDPATVGRGARSRANDLPANATRVVTRPRGVHGVWVNGQRVADENGAVHKPLPGRLLRQWQ
ncbi:MAG: amidohydrolase family protein [Betaproteobacteria bacterium]|nr:amidohydrolase family protein [Betaproteobacteria bacterium]